MYHGALLLYFWLWSSLRIQCFVIFSFESDWCLIYCLFINFCALILLWVRHYEPISFVSEAIIPIDSWVFALRMLWLPHLFLYFCRIHGIHLFQLSFTLNDISHAHQTLWGLSFLVNTSLVWATPCRRYKIFDWEKVWLCICNNICVRNDLLLSLKIVEILIGIEYFRGNFLSLPFCSIWLQMDHIWKTRLMTL